MNREVTISLWMRLIRYQSSSYNESMYMQKLVCSQRGSVVTDMLQKGVARGSKVDSILICFERCITH